MPWAHQQKEITKLPLALAGASFWLGAVGTIAAAMQIHRNRSKKRSPKKAGIRQSGLCCFFQNPEAMVADGLLFASILGFILIRICTDSLYGPFIFLALFVFSFGMHCMLNGKGYQSLNQQVRREKEL